MQTIIVWIIVALAVGYLACTFFGKKKTGACGCGCESCGAAGGCDAAAKGTAAWIEPRQESQKR